MKLITNTMEKLKVPKKEENKIFSSWFSIATDELKEELNKLSDRDVKNNFSSHLKFGRRDLRSSEGMGSNKINEITFDRITRAIIKFANKKGWTKAMIGVSDKESKNFYLKMVSKLMENNIEVKSFKDPESLLPEVSFAMSNRNYDFGIYLDWNKGNVSITVLGDRGRLLKRIELEDLQKILLKTDYTHENTTDNVGKIQIVDHEIRKKYENLINRNIKGLPLGTIEKCNSTIINTTSKLVYNKMNEIFSEQEWVYVHLSEKFKNDQSFDVSSTDSYREAYFKSFKKKAKFMFNIDGTGSRMSMAYKHNKTWLYETPGKTMAFMLNKLKQENLLREGHLITLTIDSSPLLLDYARNNKLHLKIKEDSFSSSKNQESNYRSDNDDRFSIIPEINSSEAIVSTMILISHLANKQEKFSFTKEVADITYKSHYTRRKVVKKTLSEFKDDVKEINETKKIGELDVKSVKVMLDDEWTTYIKVTVKDGYFINRYSKFKELLEITYHILSSDNEVAFEVRKKISSGHKSILNQDYKIDDSKVSKKTIISVIVGFIFFTVILAAIFTSLFDIDSIKSSFKQIGEKSGTPYPYLLIILYPVQRFLGPLIYKAIFKQLDIEMKYKDLFVALFLASFVSRVGISWLMGPGILIWYLRGKGYSGSKILNGILINNVVLTLLQTILSIYFIGVGANWMNGMPPQQTPGLNSHAATMMALAGWAFLLFNMVMQTGLAFWKGFHNFINFWMELGLFMVGKQRNFRTINESMIFNFLKMRRSFKTVLFSPKRLAMISLVWFPAWLIGSLETTFAINITADVPMTNYWQTMTVGSLISSATEFFGMVPGGNGTTEWVSLAFMKGIVGGNLTNFNIEPDAINFDYLIEDKANQIAFLDRFNVYVATGVSGVFFTVFTVKYNIDKFKN